MADEVEELTPETINIQNLCKGAAVDAFDIELHKCLINIYDLDTPALTARTITLKVKLKPDEARIRIGVEFTCESNLAQPHAVQDVFYVGQDKETGTLFGLKHDPRQQSIVFSAPKPKEAPQPIAFKGSKK